jgi:hypothetical protein
MPPPDENRQSAPWLLLIHQIPPKPDYLRVKIGRRLHRIGSVAVKNSVYVLPDSGQALEDFQWVRAEITAGGGDASICRADFVDGLTNEQIELLFRGARDAEYAEIAEEARAIWGALRGRERSTGSRIRPHDDLVRLRKRIAEIRRVDFFDAPGRVMAEEAVRAVASEVESPADTSASTPVLGQPGEYRERTWVTRSGVFVDRIASAWLIRRFIDRDARFKFVDGAKYRPRDGELRFDMFDGEFTHEGDQCTFEMLISRFALSDPALGAIAEIVHDIDLKDAKFEREETIGIERVLSGIAAAHADDDVRIERGGQLFDDLYALFSNSSLNLPRDASLVLPTR